MSNFSSIMGNFGLVLAIIFHTGQCFKKVEQWKMLPSRMRVSDIREYFTIIWQTRQQCLRLISFVWKENWTAVVIKVVVVSLKDNNPFSNSPPSFFTRGWNFFLLHIALSSWNQGLSEEINHRRQFSRKKKFFSVLLLSQVLVLVVVNLFVFCLDSRQIQVSLSLFLLCTK